LCRLMALTARPHPALVKQTNRTYGFAGHFALYPLAECRPSLVQRGEQEWGEQGICRQPGTLLEMSNLETNGARSEIGLERLNCIQCVRFFVGSPLQYCCVLMLMIGALKFDIWLPKPAQHYSHFVYRDFPGKL
jgi:hypothetical protein